MTTDAKKGKPVRYPIRARSHLLKLLGDELIGDDRLAIFELVKNGYDADATCVNVTLSLSDPTNQHIIVKDNGSGMAFKDITDKWLELATESKRKDPPDRSPKFRRLPLGEKGIGRIAVLKLGGTVTMTTRSGKGPEHEVTINWDDLFKQGPYLENLGVQIKENNPAKIFKTDNGTQIKLTRLRRTEWSRADIRKLVRLVNSLASPFETPDEFKVEFSAPGRETDYHDMLDREDMLKCALWKFSFEIKPNADYSWDYSFTPPRWGKIKPQATSSDGLERLPKSNVDGQEKTSKKPSEPLVIQKEDLAGIGRIRGTIFAYNRRSEVLNATGGASQLKAWLDDQTGVRVYRDGVRVFTYGEGNDDWLGLNARRINTPAGKLGTSVVVAAVHLDLKTSHMLREKTNREGFDENDAFERFRLIVLSAFEHFENLHADDRRSIDSFLKGAEEQPPKFADAIANLKSGLEKHGAAAEFKRDIEAIESEFNELRDVMVNAGTAGLNLAVVFHEIEREVDALSSALDAGIDTARLREQIDHLYELLHGFAPLLRKNPVKHTLASEIIRVAVRLREHRLKFHEVQLSAPILSGEEPDFKIRGPTNLLIGCIGNLLDNALHWARFRKERDGRKASAAILVTTDWDEKSRSGMISVVDNGTGFSLPPARAVEPFKTTRPGGMGLGLYFANLVMEQAGGVLTIQTASELRDELEIPKVFDGAAVTMRFGGAE